MSVEAQPALVEAIAVNSEMKSAPASDALQSMARRHDLDALRAIAMLLGVVLHGILSFVPLPDQAWSVHDTQQSEVFAVILSVIHGFRMQLFFLISGFFTAMLWRKRGLRSVLWQRTKRILLPLVIGTCTIVPAVWVVSISAGILSATRNLEPETVPLWSYAARGDLGKIEQGLDSGADPNEKQLASGMTALSLATLHGQTEAVKLLVENGADVNARNQDGSTALHQAALSGQPDITRVLLEHHANRVAKDRLGNTPADRLATPGLTTVMAGGILGAEMSPKEVIQKRLDVAKLLSSGNDQLVAQQQLRVDQAETDPVEGLGVSGLISLLLFYLPIFHHLWFLWFLCWLVAAFSIYAILADRLSIKIPRWMVASPGCLLWLIPLTLIPQAFMGLTFPDFGPETSIGFVPVPQILLYYAVFFFFGVFAFEVDSEGDLLGKWWKVTIPFALLVVFPVGYEFTIGLTGFSEQWLDEGWVRPAAVLLQVVYAWLMVIGLMGMFRQLFQRESRTLRYISDSSYWLYLAHLPLIIVGQSIIQTWPLPAAVKLTLLCGVSFALLLASYQWCVRYTPIGTLLNGPRQRVARVT